MVWVAKKPDFSGEPNIAQSEQNQRGKDKNPKHSQSGDYPFAGGAILETCMVRSVSEY